MRPDSPNRCQLDYVRISFVSHQEYGIAVLFAKHMPESVEHEVQKALPEATELKGSYDVIAAAEPHGQEDNAGCCTMEEEIFCRCMS